jgi:hypothetical protein
MTTRREERHQLISCGLCGHRFELSEAARVCERCPLTADCGVVCCPHCGYSFPRESRIVSWLRRLLRR